MHGMMSKSPSKHIFIPKPKGPEGVFHADFANAPSNSQLAGVLLVKCRSKAALAQRADMTNEERFRETTHIRHDLHVLSKDWDSALPMIQARLPSV